MKKYRSVKAWVVTNWNGDILIDHEAGVPILYRTLSEAREFHAADQFLGFARVEIRIPIKRKRRGK